MNGNEIFEKPRIKNRLKEITTLALFTIAVAILSVVVMDVLVYPIAYLSIRKPRVFTFLMNYTILFLVLFSIVFIIWRRYRLLRKEGLPRKKIVSFLMYKPVYYSAVTLFVLALTTLIVGFLYFLLHYNYYLLYRLTL